MNSSTQAQSEQNHSKTIKDLHQAFANLTDSYNKTCRNTTLPNLAILQADCALLAGVAQALKSTDKQHITGGSV